MTSFSLVLSIALSAGINLYLTLFTLGIGIRFQWIGNVPHEYDMIASIPVLAVTGTLSIVRFFVGKIPYADTVWDFFHTIIRPAAAVALSTGLTADMDPATTAAVSATAGLSALTSHSSKMGLHTIINTSPEPFTNVVAGLFEDSFVIGMVLFALRYPYIAGGIALFVLIVMLVTLPIMIRWAKFGIAALLSRLRPQRTEWDPMPENYYAATNIKGKPVAILRGTVRGLGRLSGRKGYLCVYKRGIALVYARWLRQPGTWKLDLRRVRDAAYIRGLLLDTLEIQYLDKKQDKEKSVRFVFLKERANLSQDLANLLDADTRNGTLAEFIRAGGQLATDVHKRATDAGSTSPVEPKPKQP